jgi:hypothetical protein
MTDDSRFDPASWRAIVMPWVMAGARLGAGWFVSRPDLAALVGVAAPLRPLVAAPLAIGIPVLIGTGLLAFAWPRTYLAGAVLLGAGLGIAEWLWQRMGMAPGPLPWSLGAIAVLTLGEWLSRRLQRQLSRD